MSKSEKEKASAVSAIKKKSKPVAGRTAQRDSKTAPANGDPFPPLGDPTWPSGILRIMTPKRTPKPQPSFNYEYIPLDAMQRRARRGLVQQWLKTHDSFVAEALAEQERIEIPYREQIAAAYGKDAGWRDALIVAARTDERAREELASWLSSVAAKGERAEFFAFYEAMSRVANVDERGVINRKKLLAILFVLHCWIEKNALPTQAATRVFLASQGYKMEGSSRQNEARDLFIGPILGTLPKAKAGRKELASTKLPSTKAKKMK